MNARSALFDLYGDHLRARGGSAPVAALVRLLAPLDIAAPAVRTAVSRMVRQGWLEPVRLPAGRGYRLTERGAHRLEDAARRIYGSANVEWDGHWHLVVVERPTSRAMRNRLHDWLGFLGYARLDERTWVAPRPSTELDGLLESARVRADRFQARFDGDGASLVRRAWDLDGLARSYESWRREARTLVAEAPDGCDDEQAYATRSRLVHEWRKFLFRDPGLPRCLLPVDWPGVAAGAFFDEQARRLKPAATRFVESVLVQPANGART